jgi:DNA-binding response OmpR family regulator
MNVVEVERSAASRRCDIEGARAAMMILVVEDEPLAALNAMFELQRAGYEVVGPARTQEDALRLARECQPELALVDIDLSEAGEGVELAKHLRALSVASLFVSGQSEVAQENRDFAVGFLGKPYSSTELVRSVQVVDAVLHGGVPPPAVPQALRLFS